MKKPTIYLLMGLPGAGKSFWVAQNLSNIPVVCPDDIRCEVFGVEFDKEVEDYVWATTWREIHLLLDGGVREIVFDACNVRKIHRAPVFFYYPECDVVGVWVQTPVEVCKERRPVTETFTADVIDRMALMWEDPVLEEGFKEIRIVNNGMDNGERQVLALGSL